MAIQVLSIGNSFSQDAQRYLHDVAKSEGVALETVNLYIGGCSLERHYRNMKGDYREYSLEMNGHTAGGFFVSIKGIVFFFRLKQDHLIFLSLLKFFYLH